MRFHRPPGRCRLAFDEFSQVVVVEREARLGLRDDPGEREEGQVGLFIAAADVCIEESRRKQSARVCFIAGRIAESSCGREREELTHMRSCEPHLQQRLPLDSSLPAVPERPVPFPQHRAIIDPPLVDRECL